MKDLEPTAMNGTLITDLIDMVQKRMGIDLESLGANPAGNLVSGDTYAFASSARHATIPSAHLWRSGAFMAWMHMHTAASQASVFFKSVQF